MELNFKRIAALIMVLLTIVTTSGAVKIDGIYYYFEGNSAIVTFSQDGFLQDGIPKDYGGEVIIPKEVTYGKKKYTVSGVGFRAFYHCTDLTSVTFPESLSAIGEDAFIGCTSLTSLTFPESLTSIGENAFMNCTSLKNLEFHCNSITLREECFANCGILDTVLFDCKKVIPRGNGVFGDPIHAPYIKTLTFGPDVLSISDGSTYHYAILHAKKAVWLGDTPPTGSERVSSSINYVPNETFGFEEQKIYPFLNSKFTLGGVVYVPVDSSERTCDVLDCNYDSAISDILITDKVINHGIEYTVNEINSYSFWDNDYITSAQLYNNGAIGTYAFAKCTNLASATLATSIKCIYDYAFWSSGLGSIVIPNSVTFLGSYAFFECKSLESASIGTGIQALNWETFGKCSALSDITIPANIGLVDAGVFSHCSSLAQVNIKDGEKELTFLSGPAFGDCPLKNVYIEKMCI